ncbi:MAG: hypothetical protein F6K23_07780 [Okeania sp. SIO2C9]|uniref:hypothetical protein n=1 Tax=Okeania sp. SIO2C9 TaxID=2607791 RepID=UPI0013BFCF97|nr:hypothetical protein [Okeania sp. SIO2C9]NEQ72981.1 hypothetical protein [Okeania sp. SIO2C9]
MLKVEAIAANKSMNNINSDRSYNLPKTRTFRAIDKNFSGKGYIWNAIVITRRVATANSKYMKCKHLRPFPLRLFVNKKLTGLTHEVRKTRT